MFFNPRPRREGDPLSAQVIPIPLGYGDSFNPRPRREGDAVVTRDKMCFNRALAGSTVRSHRVFQSAPSQGGRPVASVNLSSYSEFQSAPSQGGRHGLKFRSRTGVGFNPPSQGGTTLVGDHLQASLGKCFNPRPRREGDRLLSTIAIGLRGLFQSAPSQGGRRKHPMPYNWQDTFQSAPSQGGRRMAFELTALSHRCNQSFQSAPSQGGRL